MSATFYMKLGEVPRKRHIKLPREKEKSFKGEGIHYEHVVTTAGFDRAYSIMYHLRPPTRVRASRLLFTVSGRSIHSEALEQGRTGPHHLRCKVEDIAATQTALEQHGLRPVWGQRYSPEVAFQYLEGLDDLYLELIEWKLPPGVMPAPRS